MGQSSWKQIKLGDVADIVGGGTPDTKNPLYWGGKISWITPKDLSGYSSRYISQGERHITEAGLKHSSAVLLPERSILLTSRAPIGYLAISTTPLATNQGFKSLVLHKEQYPEFYYYLLKANTEYIQNMGSGSTFKEISGKVVKELSFVVPEYQEQKRIAGVLGAFDDKIELLQKQNTTLENMAKALFKSWFVDFDVVHAKQQGQPKAAVMQQYHLTEELYNLFPSSFEPSSLGPIPTGWQVKKIQDLAKVVGGGTPSTKEPAFFAPKGTAIAWLTPKDLSGYAYKYISCGQTDITNKGLDNSSAQLMPKNTIVFSSRAPIGYIAVSLGNITTNQGFKSLIPSKTYYTEFLYHFLCYNKQKIEGLGTGSTFKEISGSVMKSISLYVPNEKILEKFEDQSVIINEKLKNNQKQIQTLTEMRDGLLPRLISGKIRV